MAEATQPSIDQGDSDDGLRVQLASILPPKRASSIQIVEPRSVDKFNANGKAAAGGRWTVQVGSFNNRSDAREQLAMVVKKFAQHFGGARGVAEKDGGKYRARFSGLSEDDAKDACRAMKAKRQPCQVIRG
jgi:D-alanyl-D-alanine carboxypeptidase (penicillin-binding protein 5/6)